MHTALAHVWRSENDLKVSVLTFFHVSPRMELKTVRLGGKFLYALS